MKVQKESQTKLAITRAHRAHTPRAKLCMNFEMLVNNWKSLMMAKLMILDMKPSLGFRSLILLGQESMVTELLNAQGQQVRW